MPNLIRFIRPARRLRPNEHQAKIPMASDPTNPRKRSWSWIPVRDPEIYPLLVCVTTGLGLLTIYSIHNFADNPDINISKIRRETPTIERYDPQEAEKFTHLHGRFATLRPNAVNTYEPAFGDHHFDEKNSSSEASPHTESDT